MLQLTIDDIQILLKACDALEAQAPMEMFSKAMAGIMTAGSKESAERHLDQITAKFEKEEEKHALLREQLILLKAKLITARSAKLNNMGETTNAVQTAS